jgi:hypothetical protein
MPFKYLGTRGGFLSGLGRISLGASAIVPAGQTVTFFNTADQTTNFEKVTLGWTSNVFKIEMTKGGTGTQREIRLESDGNYLLGIRDAILEVSGALRGDANNAQFALNGRISTGTAQPALRFDNSPSGATSFTGSSGTQTHLLLTGDINQSGTGGYRILDVRAVEVATGSGTKSLAVFRAGAAGDTIRGTLDSSGNLDLAGGFASYNTAIDATNYERFRGSWSGNVFLLRQEIGGTGVAREARFSASDGTYLGVAAGVLTMNGALRHTAGNNTLSVQASMSTSTSVGLSFINNGSGGSINTASSGTQQHCRIASDINQSGTAGYRILRVQAGEVSQGSGTKELLDVLVNTEVKFGVYSASGSGAHSAGVGGNVGVNTASAFGSGAGVIGIANATTAPSTNPSGGGVLYATAGAGTWRGSSGTVTTFGPAEPHCQDCGRDCALEWRNPDAGWHLALCMWCLTDSLGMLARGTGRGVITKTQN